MTVLIKADCCKDVLDDGDDSVLLATKAKSTRANTGTDCDTNV
jgi:hypothetical protein